MFRFDNGSVIILKNDDKVLLNQLKSLYEHELVDVEVTARYNSTTNTGHYRLEIVLLNKVCALPAFLVGHVGLPICRGDKWPFGLCMVAGIDSEKLV